MSQPLVLGLVSDMFFSVPIENALTALGFRARWLQPEDELVSTTLAATARHPGEPLAGPSAAFIALLAEEQPALVIVELNSTTILWAKWVAALKSSAATRRIPVLAFGPHTDLDLRARALDVGCDAVLAQGRFIANLPGLIEKYARRVDEAALTDACQGELSALARKGIALFNQHEFFEAHEELEHAWNEEPGPARELYRGILQVAVAYLQITRRNYNGALKMFLRMRQWLDPLPEACRRVDVAQLRADALAVRAELEQLGAERIAEFQPNVFKPIVIRDDSLANP